MSRIDAFSDVFWLLDKQLSRNDGSTSALNNWQKKVQHMRDQHGLKGFHNMEEYARQPARLIHT